MLTTEKDKEVWAICELMGHLTLAGRPLGNAKGHLGSGSITMQCSAYEERKD